MQSRTHKALAIAAALSTAALVPAGSAAADGAVRPDDRSTHGPGAVITTQIERVLRPDDRADRRLVSSQVPPVAPTTTETFDWADAGIGALATLGAVMVVGGAAIVGLRRRPELA